MTEVPRERDSLPAPATTTVIQKLSTPTLIAAGAVLIFFLYLTWIMFFDRLAYKEIYWSRAMSIYSVIEAFALAAAGVLLGTHIQSGRIADAERRAEVKDAEAGRAQEQAVRSNSELAGQSRVIDEAWLLLEGMGGAPEEAAGAPAHNDRLAELRGLLSAARRR